MGLFGFLFGSAVPLEQRRISLEDQSPLGAYLTPEELLERAKVCSGAKFRPGSSLPESPFYVVVSGQVEVRDPNGSVLCTKYPGSFFTRWCNISWCSSSSFVREPCFFSSSLNDR